MGAPLSPTKRKYGGHWWQTIPPQVSKPLKPTHTLCFQGLQLPCRPLGMAIAKLEAKEAGEASHHLAIGGPEAMGQLAQAAEVTLEARQLGGRGMVGLTQGLAGVRLLLPQAGAEREQQVTGQQLDHLQEPGGPGTHAY